MIKIRPKPPVPEVFANCPDYRDNIQVSNYGNLMKNGIPLEAYNHGNGYRIVDLFHIDLNKRVKVYVHRLVGLAFVAGRSEERNFIDHKNRIRADNRAINLRWVSHFENSNNAAGKKNDGLRGGIYKSGNGFLVEFNYKKYLPKRIQRKFSTMQEGQIYLDELRLQYPEDLPPDIAHQSVLNDQG